MKHSILLLSFNRPTFVREAIGSVLAQSHRDFELIIADDGSAVPVPDILKWYADRDSRIKILWSGPKDETERTTTQRGQANINAVLKSGMVTGETISYMADDDFYLPNRLRVFDEYFGKYPEIDCLYSDQITINEQLMNASLRGTAGVTKAIACKIDMGSVIHRTRIFEKVGYWENFDCGDEAFGLPKFQVVDGLFFDKIAKAGYYFYPVNIPLDVHRYHKLSYCTALERKDKDMGGWRE